MWAFLTGHVGFPKFLRTVSSTDATDEWLTKDKLEIQVKYLDEHPDVHAVCGLPQQGMKDPPEGERPLWEQYYLKAHNRSREQWLTTFLNMDHVPVRSVSSLFRRSVLDTLGYFEPSLRHLEIMNGGCDF